ncbi:Xaa-Pro aminopeptidase [Dasania sp. GY-MA-18]|uniref:Xaa-Pro aminopeptidase n=1 Tax=Dasania phycosphaerae TaxID=2950436 RepID=A0A9J6RJG5_9GAMM|nr:MULTISPECIES: Xaa-Pro aminopeptidase [Dasania]MCR8922183.1 Xaa-Pro aminopeptidase [Dasania sp. GY-MA-18]MCZ0864611.1 Xaa-Pro aminopeptidase [Dasania phycosphaerae]MCZ0868339.1 Xaa-Pro aminopeptidase [Dasania phycosphaerae]
MTKISKQEFARRRKNLMAQMEADSIAIVPAAKEVIRNRDCEYHFRQDSDFYYLTGFAEPDAVLLLIPGREHGETIVFCRERDPKMELWNGYRAGPEGVCADYAADDAFPVSDIDDILPGLLEGRERVYYSMGRHQDFDRRVMGWVNTIRSKVRSGAHPPGEFLDLDHLLHDLRLYKSAAEIRIMRKAGELSAQAHKRAMKICKPGLMEYQLEAEILHEFARNGARFPAYSTIVGAGKNGCVLHYIDNNCKIKDGDLILIDAGCELEHYAADITRTFPANGKFSKEQKALYNIVLDAQQQAIATIKPGNHWNQSHDITVRVITQGLLDLGLLKGKLDKLIADEAYKDFYMHRAGHWLGMDVHDVGDYKVADEWRVLEEGMVMTVEPGIYVAPDNMKVAKKWRGIGIRIEDDIVVTKDGCENLTAAAPKTVAEIEAFMSAAR